MEQTTQGQESRSTLSTHPGGSHGMQVPEEYFKLYIPAKGKFASLNGRWLTLEQALKGRAADIARTLRGVRLDTLPWIHDTIIVKVDRSNNILESYCGTCGSVTDRETAHQVCQQCIRVLDPKEM